MKNFLKPLIPFLLLYIGANAQQIQNVKATQVNEGVVISYDLTDTKPVYVSLFYSKDQGNSFSTELKQVSGDVMGNVKPGTGKKITWNAASELGAFDGDVIFKVEASSSKIAFPKPVSDEFLSVEVTDASLQGSSLKIEFTVTNISDMPVLTGAIRKDDTLILDDKGNALESFDVRIANKPAGEYIEYSKDVPYKGYVTVKNVNPEISLISLLKLNYNANYKHTVYSIKNIPVSK
jgi:hypothetical protein